MRKLNKNFKIASLFLLLLVVAATPVLITEFRNQRLIDKPNIIAISTKSLEIDGNTNFDNNIIKRIQTIVKVRTSKTGVTTEQQISVKDKISNELIESFKEQIIILQKIQALPQFDITNEYSIDYLEKTTFMDSINPDNLVSVWNIAISYQGLGIRGIMDIDTSVIYEISIYSEDDNIQLNKSQVSVEEFLKYLKIDPNKVEQKYDHIYHFYSDDNIYIMYYFIKQKDYFEYSLTYK